MHMSIRWAIAAVGALALALLTLNATPEWGFHRDEASAAATGAPATYACPAAAKPANLNFTLKDINNTEVPLASLKGKVVLLDFWATWCGPCKIEIPWFIEFERKNKDNGFAVIGVSMDEEGWTVVKPFIADLAINYRIVQGDDQTATLFGGVDSLPTTFLIDR